MAAPTPQEFAATMQAYQPLYGRLKTITSPQPLLLAHYTSVETIEKIFKNDEIWLSNPLYMNDLEEMRLGILLAAQIFPQFAQQAAQGDVNRTNILVQSFNHYLAYLQNESAIDTYIFCLCKHDIGDTDGLLSMWREYGVKGNGAALVFNAQNVTFRPSSPLLIAEVAYCNAQQREQQLRDHLAAWTQITLQKNLHDHHLYLASYSAFLFAKLVALTTKHRGFYEEREVRVIYIPEHDPRGFLRPHLSYYIGPRGVEPKLKFKFGLTLQTTDSIRPVDEFTTGNLADLVAFIMLGPSISSPLAKASFTRMLHGINRAGFADRVETSTIPLRPTLPS